MFLVQVLVWWKLHHHDQKLDISVYFFPLIYLFILCILLSSVVVIYFFMICSFQMFKKISILFPSVIWWPPSWFSSVQLLSRVWLFVTPWTAPHQASLSISNSRSLLKLMSIELMMPFNHLILCRPLLLPPRIFPSIRVFPNESALHIRWPKYWSCSFSISPSNDLLQDGLVGSPCSPRDSQESSPTPQFKSIESLALRFLYSPTLTSVHDYWENHSFD